MLSRASMMMSLETLKTSFALDIKLFEESVSRDIGTEGCAHLAYYVRVNHNYAMGREQRVDWPSSWRLQQVGDPEWEELKSSIRREYDALIETLESLETWGDQELGEILPIVAHTAYHLGAIRHAVKHLRHSVER